MANRILFLNAPELNQLGQHRPEIYGKESLDDIFSAVGARAAEYGFELVDMRAENVVGLTNGIYRVIGDRANFAGIIMNAGNFGSSSTDLKEALRVANDSEIPIVEVRLVSIMENIQDFKFSPFSQFCRKTITNFRPALDAYGLALIQLLQELKSVPC